MGSWRFKSGFCGDYAAFVVDKNRVLLGTFVFDWDEVFAQGL